MTTNARNELIEGLKRDLYEFWFLDAMAMPLQPIYPRYFQSSAIQGSSEVRNSAMLNVTFKETNGQEAIEYTDPTSGRKFVGKLRRHTAATSFERDLLDKDASKQALRDVLRQWQMSAQKALIGKKEQYYADLINYGGYSAGNAIYNNTSELFSGSNYMYDGKPLLNISTNGRSLLKVPAGVTNGAFYNSLGPSGYDLTSDNFDAAYTLISSTNAINDAGQREAQFPNVLLVNPALRGAAAQVLETMSGVPGEVNNGFNHNNGIVTAVLNPYVTGTTSWYLIANTGKFLAYDQEPPIWDIWFDQETKSYKVSIDVRFGHCFTGWQCIAGGNIATS